MSSRLDRIRIATPCPVSWEQMVGDDRVRFCKHCELNVYNLSSLSRHEAEALLSSNEGRLCARLYRRHDGTVLTEDCSVGLSRLRRRVVQTAAAVFALIGSLNTVAFGQKGNKKESCRSQISVTQKDVASSIEETVVTGEVTDPQNAVVLGVTVTVINDAKKTETTRTNDEGRFQFIGLLPGKYSVKVQRSGFMKLTITELQIKKNQATNIDVSLLPTSDDDLIGVVAYSEENDPPGTTTIRQKIINSLPH